MNRFFQLAFGCLLLAACSSGSSVNLASLSMSVTGDGSLHNDGKPITVEVDAVDSNGKPGTGTVNFFAASGFFVSNGATTISVPLVNGAAVTTYACDGRKDTGCALSPASFLATWNGQTTNLNTDIAQTLPILSASCDDTCEQVAGSLAGLRWALPCGSKVTSFSCNLASTAPVSAVLSGTAGASYSVSLRFRGVVETNSYVGGTSDGAFWQIGGASAPNNVYNVLKLSISSPAQTYYVNRGQSGIPHCWAIDYSKTVVIDSGATVELSFSDTDGQEIDNIDENGKPIVIAGLPGQPYNGQFVHMDVLELTRN
jgi:hypothetical protein